LLSFRLWLRPPFLARYARALCCISIRNICGSS
jgi:hypothetical protein